MPPMQDDDILSSPLPETETETDTHVFDTAASEWEKSPPETHLGKRNETEMHVYDSEISNWQKRDDGSWYRCEYIRLQRQKILPATHILDHIHTGQYRVASNNTWMVERKISAVLVLDECIAAAVSAPTGVTIKSISVSEETLESTFGPSAAFIAGVIAAQAELLIVDSDNRTHIAPTLVAYLVSAGWPLDKATGRICEVYKATFSEHTQACLIRWTESIKLGVVQIVPDMLQLQPAANDIGSPMTPAPAELRVQPTPQSGTVGCPPSGEHIPPAPVSVSCIPTPNRPANHAAPQLSQLSAPEAYLPSPTPAFDTTPVKQELQPTYPSLMKQSFAPQPFASTTQERPQERTVEAMPRPSSDQHQPMRIPDRITPPPPPSSSAEPSAPKRSPSFTPHEAPTVPTYMATLEAIGEAPLTSRAAAFAELAPTVEAPKKPAGRFEEDHAPPPKKPLARSPSAPSAVHERLSRPAAHNCCSRGCCARHSVQPTPPSRSTTPLRGTPKMAALEDGWCTPRDQPTPPRRTSTPAARCACKDDACYATPRSHQHATAPHSARSGTPPRHTNTQVRTSTPPPATSRAVPSSSLGLGTVVPDDYDAVGGGASAQQRARTPPRKLAIVEDRAAAAGPRAAATSDHVVNGGAHHRSAPAATLRRASTVEDGLAVIPSRPVPSHAQHHAMPDTSWTTLPLASMIHVDEEAAGTVIRPKYYASIFNDRKPEPIRPVPTVVRRKSVTFEESVSAAAERTPRSILKPSPVQPQSANRNISAICSQHLAPVVNTADEFAFTASSGFRVGG